MDPFRVRLRTSQVLGLGLDLAFPPLFRSGLSSRGRIRSTLSACREVFHPSGFSWNLFQNIEGGPWRTKLIVSHILMPLLSVDRVIGLKQQYLEEDDETKGRNFIWKITCMSVLVLKIHNKLPYWIPLEHLGRLLLPCWRGYSSSHVTKPNLNLGRGSFPVAVDFRAKART